MSPEAAGSAGAAAHRAPVDAAAPGNRPVRTIVDAVGDTPLIRTDDVWGKLEYLNPSGSIKARIAR